MDKTKDYSTLEFLHPLHSFDVALKIIKNDTRLQGSSFFVLKQPHRIPEYSRPYVPGDPVQLIDWKAFARSDQLIIQEKRGETSTRVLIGIEIHDAMNWPESTSVIENCSKFNVALRVALHLAYIHLKLSDKVTLFFIDRWSNTLLQLQPKSPAVLADVFAFFLQKKFEMKSVFELCQAQMIPQKRADVGYYIGDLLGEANSEKFFELSRLHCMIHTLHHKEMSTSWLNGTTCYYDETIKKNEFLGSFLQSPIKLEQEVAKWCAQQKENYHKKGCSYFLASDRTPILQLHQFLGMLNHEWK